MNDSQVKFPLRPTLLVVAADAAYEARSLGELTVRTLSGDMHRLTARFSRRAWNIPVLEAQDPDLFSKAWAGLEGQNMAVISGYDGAPEQVAALKKLSQAAHPIATLIGLGKSLQLEDDAFAPFKKSLTLLPAPLSEQYVTAHQAMKACRHEHSWGQRDTHRLETESGSPAKTEYIN